MLLEGGDSCLVLLQRCRSGASEVRGITQSNGLALSQLAVALWWHTCSLGHGHGRCIHISTYVRCCKERARVNVMVLATGVLDIERVAHHGSVTLLRSRQHLHLTVPVAAIT